MKILVVANGDGRSRRPHNISIFAYIIEGKYDADLKWPFVGDVKLELLNQLEDKNHHSMVVHSTPEHNKNAGDPGRGYYQYIPHSKLSRDSASNTQYLKDDTLYFSISVKVPDHKPWLTLKS